jgi:predicted  nucleic acid-binding Zn-ribbon protein
LNGRYFRPYASRLGEKYPNNELLIAMQQAMDDINSLRRVIGYTEEEIHQSLMSLMSKPNELEELNNLLNKLKNQLENELLPKAEMAINSNSTLFDSLSFRWFSEYKY